MGPVDLKGEVTTTRAEITRPPENKRENRKRKPRQGYGEPIRERGGKAQSTNQQLYYHKTKRVMQGIRQRQRKGKGMGQGKGGPGKNRGKRDTTTRKEKEKKKLAQECLEGLLTEIPLKRGGRLVVSQETNVPDIKNVTKTKGKVPAIRKKRVTKRGTAGKGDQGEGKEEKGGVSRGGAQKRLTRNKIETP